MRSFYKFLLREEYVGQNPFTKVRTPKLDKRLPVFLEETEIDSLLDLPDATPLGLRDQAVLEMLYATGCRVSELAGLRLADVDLSGYCYMAKAIRTASCQSGIPVKMRFSAIMPKAGLP